MPILKRLDLSFGFSRRALPCLFNGHIATCIHAYVVIRLASSAVRLALGFVVDIELIMKYSDATTMTDTMRSLN